uniref:Putative roadkill n=2 Tax=Parasteatoda tepidariorum TaxID=114398 RepID=A0A2L2YG14_PARTP
MEVKFEYSDKASITEVKSFNKNSTTALTQNKDEIDSLLYLQQHLRNMLNEKNYADVKLRADGEVFFAHKCLLASRSPVFRAMFDREMLESKTSVIDMRDVEAKTLKYFLEYLYTGTVDGMDDKMALNLLLHCKKSRLMFIQYLVQSLLIAP